MANKGVGESKLAEGSLPTSAVVSASQEPIVQVIPLERAPIAAVTVYTEAVAEVLRRIDLENGDGEWEAGATVEVVVQGLTRHVDKNSVRVNGHGPAKILHVSTESNFYNGTDDNAADGKKGTEDLVTKKLREELQECRITRTRLQQEYERVDRRLQLIQSYTNNVATQPSTTNDKKPLGLQDFRGVLDFYSENAEDADGKRTQLRKQGEEVDAKIVALERQLMERGGNNQPDVNKETCAITVLVEVTGFGKIELELRYLVQGAQWHASYDVRISSAEGKTVGLTYYGLVSQATEEDWVNVHLSLSTATPSKGGVPPRLPTRHAKFWQPAVYRAMAKSSSVKRKEATNFAFQASADATPAMPQSFGFSSNDAPRGASFAALGGFGGGAQDDEDEASIGGAVASVEVRSVAALGPSTFNIHKLTTIKCDRKPQKCTIGVLTLNSTFRHYVVPSKETNAYLQSKTVNVSDYTLMPSNDVSIFFDNNFVAKTELKLVQPGEEFQAFLGVDPAVRVDYSAPKTLTSSTGLFSRQKAKSYETVTTITNQKGMPVTVAVVESLPLSQSDKIKVSLVAPAFESLTQVSVADDVDVGSSEESRASGNHSDGTFLNKETNNVVFLRELAPKAKIQLPFKYTIDWPSGSEVVVEPAAPPQDPARFVNRLF